MFKKIPLPTSRLLKDNFSLFMLFKCLFIYREIDVLGWASAQVVCICSINPQKVQMIGKNVKTSSLPTTVKSNCTSLTPSRGERGSVIYSSNPKILVCDLKLSGDTITDCKFFFGQYIHSYIHNYIHFLLQMCMKKHYLTIFLLHLEDRQSSILTS